MKTYLAMLRGINVSGQKKISMAELKSLFESLDFEQVKTYIQSGHVLFKQEVMNHEEQAKRIEKKIAEQYGFAVPVIVRSQEELAEAIDKNPFLNEPGVELDKLHVTFLTDAPSPANYDKIKDVSFGSDRFRLAGKNVYVYCPGGYGVTKLSNAFFETKLKETATTRNWKTVNELLRMMEPAYL
ncbi:DUF1697 domain-containing protein [Larkinella ripae]